MEARTLQYVADACGGQLSGGSPNSTISRVCTDSRKIQSGELFFALAGERFDGHSFVGQVVAKGATAVVVESNKRPVEPCGCAVLVVDNTRQALGRLAAQYRREFTLPVVAVAGSNGKTTTKDLLSSVLRQARPTLSSEASYNNDIGVPLTLLGLECRHQVAVLEVGTNHPGELAPLVEMIRPQYGVVTSIGREHLEFFGDVAAVAQEQGWLAELLPPDGKLFINGDSQWAQPIASRTRAAVGRLGLGERNDWRALDLHPDKQGIRFQLEGPVESFRGQYRVPLFGRHQAINALLAIAVAAELGLTRAEVEKGLADCKPARMRMQIWELNGVSVLNDAYNANADSMLAALETLQELPCKGRRVAVLGDMAELGAHSQAAHKEVGRRAAELGVGQLFAVGHMAPVVAQAAREAGLNRVLEFADVETAAMAVKSFLRQGDLVLLKASRVARLERIADLLGAPEAVRKN